MRGRPAGPGIATGPTWNWWNAAPPPPGNRTSGRFLRFLHNDPLGQVQPDEDFDPSGIITFRVRDRVTVDNPAVRTFWASANAPGAEDAPTMQCLVCGNYRPVLDRLQARIKGIPGGQTAGTSLISANSDAFESYGLSASLIAPTCSNCGEAFTRGLNALLSGEGSRLASGGSVFVFWTREEVEFNFLSAIDDPDPSRVQALLETVRTGRWTEVDEGPFYALSLSASGGRAVVRDWLDTTVGNAKRNLAAWFRRQRIASWSEEMPRYYGLRALAFATVREPRDFTQDHAAGPDQGRFNRCSATPGHSAPGGAPEPGRAGRDPSSGRPDQAGAAQPEQ